MTSRQRAILEQRAEDGSLSPYARLRARALLCLAAGANDRRVALQFGISPGTVGLWRKRFVEDGGIEDKPRRQGLRLSPEKIREIVFKTKNDRPNDSERWTLCAMAKATSVSPGAVGRVWERHGLTPRASTAPQALGPVEAVIGVYLRPPECAIALQVGRGNPVLEEPDSARPSDGLLERFVEAKNSAAMLRCVWKTLEGHGVGGGEPHRFESWLHFLRLVDYATRADCGIHLLAEGCEVHQHEAVKRWMRRHPRLYVEFAAPSRPWFDRVEKRFFSVLNANTIQRDLEELALVAAATLGSAPSPHPFFWIARRPGAFLERAQPAASGAAASADR